MISQTPALGWEIVHGPAVGTYPHGLVCVRSGEVTLRRVGPPDDDAENVTVAAPSGTSMNALLSDGFGIVSVVDVVYLF